MEGAAGTGSEREAADKEEAVTGVSVLRAGSVTLPASFCRQLKVGTSLGAGAADA